MKDKTFLKKHACMKATSAQESVKQLIYNNNGKNRYNNKKMYV